MSVELKGCPFCGCDDVYLISNYSERAKRFLCM